MSNANIGFPQGADTLQTGSYDGFEIDHDYKAVRAALMNGGSPDHVGFFDDFLGDAIDSRWDEDLATGATIAVNSQAGGVIRFSTDTDDDDHATLALGLHWLVSRGLTFFEARVTSVSALTLRAIEVGVSDAVSESNGLAFSSHDATPVAVATNAAVFGYNTDESMTAWSALSVNAGGTPQYTNTGTALVAGTFQRLGLLIDAAGNVRFYINGELVATHDLGVATTSLFTPWITLKSLSGAIKSIDVDYVNIYGQR